MNQRDLFIQRCLGIAVLSTASLILVIGFRQPAEAQSAGAATLTVHVTGHATPKGRFGPPCSRVPRAFPTMHRRPFRPKRPTLTLRP